MTVHFSLSQSFGFRQDRFWAWDKVWATAGFKPHSINFVSQIKLILDYETKDKITKWQKKKMFVGRRYKQNDVNV